MPPKPAGSGEPKCRQALRYFGAAVAVTAFFSIRSGGPLGTALALASHHIGRTR